MSLSTFKKAIHELLWEKDLSTLPVWQAWSIHLLRIFQAVARDLAGGLPTLRAMSLVYTTLLSMVPLIAVSFSVLKGFGGTYQMKPLLLHIFRPLGEQGVAIADQIISFVDKIDVSLLGFMGVLLLFYTVISLIQKIERAFNYTWRITEFRGLGERFSDYLSVIMVGPVLVFTALGITATISNSDLLLSISSIEPFGSFISFATTLLPYLLIIAAFTFIYMMVPNTKVKMHSALVGAIIAGILWESCGWLFASFVANTSNYTAVYSGFAILIIFMIWLYLSWLILLIGASIAFYHQHPEQIANGGLNLQLSSRVREKMSLLLMFKLAKNFYEGNKAWNIEELSENTAIPHIAILEILNILEKEKLITRIQDQEKRYVPAKSLDQIFLHDIITAARRHGESPSLNTSNMNSNAIIDRLASQLDTSISTSLNNESLHDIIVDKTT